MHRVIEVKQAYGPVVEGEALVSEEGFSPRYDLDRWSGVIIRPGHKLEGASIVDKVCFSPPPRAASPPAGRSTTSSGRKSRRKRSSFGVTNPVMVQGAIFAGIPITAGWTPHPRGVVKTGDRVRVDPARRMIEVL